MSRRHAIAALTLLCALTCPAHAADDPRYAVTASATRSEDGQILVSLTLSHTSKQDVPNVGLTDVTTKLASPKLLLLDGQRAQLVIGSNPRPDATPDTIESGYKVDVINVKGTGRVLVITTVIENSLVTWADATPVPFAAAPEK
jgi:hypothetical protein